MHTYPISFRGRGLMLLTLKTVSFKCHSQVIVVPSPAHCTVVFLGLFMLTTNKVQCFGIVRIDRLTFVKVKSLKQRQVVEKQPINALKYWHHAENIKCRCRIFRLNIQKDQIFLLIFGCSSQNSRIHLLNLISTIDPLATLQKSLD